MATQREQEIKESIQKTKRELHRRSLDQLIFRNPLNEPFITVYDSFEYVAPPNSDYVNNRYIIEKMIREYAEYMINEEASTAVKRENKKRADKGWQPMNKFEEEPEFVSSLNLLGSNVELKKKYMKQVYGGVSKEYGMDIPPPEPKKRDRRPVDEQILAELDEEMGTEFPTHDEVLDDVEDKKEEFLKEISDDS